MTIFIGYDVMFRHEVQHLRSAIQDFTVFLERQKIRNINTKSCQNANGMYTECFRHHKIITLLKTKKKKK